MLLRGTISFNNITVWNGGFLMKNKQTVTFPLFGGLKYKKGRKFMCNVTLSSVQILIIRHLCGVVLCLDFLIFLSADPGGRAV